MKFDVSAMLAVLPAALEGWLGVFVVIGIMIAVVSAFNYGFQSGLKGRDEEKK